MRRSTSIVLHGQRLRRSLILRRTVRSVSKDEASPETAGSSFETPLRGPQDEVPSRRESSKWKRARGRIALSGVDLQPLGLGGGSYGLALQIYGQDVRVKRGEVKERASSEDLGV
jgi:hypothetical protein